MNNRFITLGGGCFWCTEAVFRQLKGVVDVCPGYAGGQTKDPTYEEVCSGTTGHAEVVRVEYDPQQISLNELLDVFFHTHDPTTLNAQGNDIGTQYRSVILYDNEEERLPIEGIMLSLNDSGHFNKEIVTVVKKIDQFYPAEKYHFNYFEKNPSKPYCSIVIAPKMSKLKDKYGSSLLRN